MKRRPLLFNLGVLFAIVLALGPLGAQAVATQPPGAPAMVPELPRRGPAPQETIVGGEIVTDTTWTAAGSPYHAVSDVTIAASATLTIEPGVEVRFDQYRALFVEGTMQAIGTATQPITFTGAFTTPVAGWWTGIQAFWGAATLDYVTVEAGGYGQGNILAYGGTVTVAHSIIRDSAVDGVFACLGGVVHISDSQITGNAGYALNYQDGSVDPQLSNLVIAGNGIDAVAFGTGDIAGARTWRNLGAPYILLGDQEVMAGAVLTVEPGVELRFDRYRAFWVDEGGTLQAIGTAAQPITFTGTFTTPVAGWWSGIYTQDGTVLLDHVTVEDGGYAVLGSIQIQGGTATIVHSTIRDSSRSGIWAGGDAVVNISGSRITGNAEYGLYNANTEAPVEAAYNWWGVSSGPMAPGNPCGNGARVSTGVNYRPFISIFIEDGVLDPPAATVCSGEPVGWYNAAGEAYTVTISGQAPSGPISPDSLYAHTFSSAGTFPYGCSNPANQMQGTITVLQPANLAVTAAHSGVPSPGARFDYTVIYQNDDVANAVPGAVLTVTIPAGTDAFTSTQNGLPFPPDQQSGRELAYQLGTLAAGRVASITLEVQLAADLVPGTPVSLTARIASALLEAFPPDNYTQDTDTIAGPDLYLGLSGDSWGRPIMAGGMMTYTLYYFNNSSFLPALTASLTQTLPVGATFLHATLDTGSGATPVVPDVDGRLLTFTIGDVPAYSGGQLQVVVQLDAGLLPGQLLASAAGIHSASAEMMYDNNYVEHEQAIATPAVDLWTDISSGCGGEIDEMQYYNVAYGNGGTIDAPGAQLILYLPPNLADVTFYVPPRSWSGGVAIWDLGVLRAWSSGPGIGIEARIAAAGPLTATAVINSPHEDSDPSNNTAQSSDWADAIHAPFLGSPNGVIMGPRPIFRGLGTPGATVSLYISGTVGMPGQFLGEGLVDSTGNWTVATTADVPTGWRWFTLTQQLDDRVSGWRATVNFITTTMPADSNSLKRDDAYMGGILMLPWVWGNYHEYTLTARLTSCANPLSPTLRLITFDNGGLMLGYDDYRPTAFNPATGDVQFNIMTPGHTSFELYTTFYCNPPSGQAQQVERVGGAGAGSWRAAPAEDYGQKALCYIDSDFFDCPPKPKPPRKVPKPPKVNPHIQCQDAAGNNISCQDLKDILDGKLDPIVDPDGLVYDSASVQAGLPMTQSLVLNAWVTATQEVGVGQFVPWNAMAYGQANPQHTDPNYPDKVERPGYYSFLVPPGKYRIEISAPGYLPFISPILQVVAAPVTFNVPLKRATGPILPGGQNGYVVCLPFVVK